MKIHIVDYGMGNIFSVQKKLLQENIDVSVSSEPKDILNADKVILLGVGHFNKAMDNLNHLSLIEPLNDFAIVKKKPILGICLGMQLMAMTSEEGGGRQKGFGWIDASVKKFQTPNTKQFKIPHMGWNNVSLVKDSDLMRNISSEDEFYFVHSFFLQPKEKEIILNETNYIDYFCSGIEKENIFGVQYHPEKSHDAGQTLLRNFISI